MAIDDDINRMSKHELSTQLRALKRQGHKTNVSGNAAELKQRLQSFKDNGQWSEATYVANTPTASIGTGSVVSAANAAPGAGLDQILLRRTGLHTITLECVNKLDPDFVGEDDDGQPAFSGKEGKLLAQFLSPVVALVDALIESKDTMHGPEISPSAAVNFETLARLLRNKLVMTIIPEAAVPLFAPFGLPYEIGTPQLAAQSALAREEDADMEAATAASLNTFEAEMARRAQEDARELARQSQDSQQSQASQGSQGSGGLVMSPSRSSTSHPTQQQPNEDVLKLQIATVQQAVRRHLFDWMESFPLPEERVWPKDFSREETKSVRNHIRKWATDQSNQVDFTVNKQPSSVVQQVVDAMLADGTFPVADAKKSGIVSSVFRDYALKVYRQSLKKQRKEDEEAQKQGEVGGNSDKGKKGKKRVRLPDSDEDDTDENAMDIDDAEGSGQTQKRQTRSHVADQTEVAQYAGEEKWCMTCFFEGKTCSLVTENEYVGACDQCNASDSLVPCRVLCEDCLQIAHDAGHGSGKEGESFLLDECPDCEIHWG